MYDTRYDATNCEGNVKNDIIFAFGIIVDGMALLIGGEILSDLLLTEASNSYWRCDAAKGV